MLKKVQHSNCIAIGSLVLHHRLNRYLNNSAKETKMKKFVLFLILCMIPVIYGFQAFGQCKTILGKKICLSDLDPTRAIPGSKEFAERAWGEAGAAAYKGAAEIMQGRNGSARPLDEKQKKYLRGRYGALVDQVRVIYGATTMDKWC